MRLKVLIGLLILFYNTSLGQTCLHKDLSSKFNIISIIQRVPSSEELSDSCIVRVTVYNKATRSHQTIEFTSTHLFEEAFKECSNVRSFTTKKNIDKEAPDNDYGDIIIADFNFDLQEDIAIKYDSGGKSPLYNYYLQDKTSTFIRSSFLSDEIGLFPEYINPEDRTLTTSEPAGVCGLGQDVYSFNRSTEKWRRKSHKIINVCK